VCQGFCSVATGAAKGKTHRALTVFRLLVALFSFNRNKRPDVAQLVARNVALLSDAPRRRLQSLQVISLTGMTQCGKCLHLRGIWRHPIWSQSREAWMA